MVLTEILSCSGGNFSFFLFLSLVFGADAAYEEIGPIQKAHVGPSSWGGITELQTHEPINSTQLYA